MEPGGTPTHWRGRGWVVHGLRLSCCADDTAQRGVTCDDCCCDHFDLLCQSSSLQGEEGMGTGYHCVCSMVSPNRDRLVAVAMAMASDAVMFEEQKKGGLASSARPSWQYTSSVGVS